MQIAQLQKMQNYKMEKLQIAKLQKIQNCKLQIVNREVGGREHGRGSNTHGPRPCEYAQKLIVVQLVMFV